MDKNEELRRRLEKKKKDLLKQDRSMSVQTEAFDPSPYTDIIMDKFIHQDLDRGDDPTAFMTGLPTNPEYDFIFGKSSVLNASQKAKIVRDLMERVLIAKEFDAEPYAKELLNLYGTPAFDVYKKENEKGEKDIDLTDYYAKYNWTKEQKQLVLSLFLDLQSEKAKKGLNKVIYPFFISAAFVLIPPFFIPNTLQRLGWLASDTGWFLKIVVGIISGIVLYFIVKKLFIIKMQSLLNKKLVV
jgi:hypothetical protein